MTPCQHQQRHVELHNALDELFADFISHHVMSENVSVSAEGQKIGQNFLQMPIIDLINWSYSQTLEPAPMYERHDSGHVVKSMEDRE